MSTPHVPAFCTLYWRRDVRVLAQDLRAVLSPDEQLELAHRLGSSGAMAVSMLLWCPQCNERHIDRGEFATKAHHTHACQVCGHVWRPAIEPTTGVQFLPGFKNEPEASA